MVVSSWTLLLWLSVCLVGWMRYVNVGQCSGVSESLLEMGLK